jgi:NAD(P)-dependent dehydrogenase (short-subunit alcohol dehydrogenase family)
MAATTKAVPPVSPFKPDLFAGRVALITGGGSGIGLSISREFGSHGAKIVIMGRREGALADAVAQMKKIGIDGIPYELAVHHLLHLM